MATTTINLPYLEDTTVDGKKIFSHKEWTERFRHYIKRTHNVDIKSISTDGTITDANWDAKKDEIRQDFIWGAGPGAINEITKGEFNTDPDTIEADRLLTLFKETYKPKRNTYHSRGDFFWAKQEESENPEEHWKKLIQIEKDCEFNGIKPEELLISKFITSITDRKLREKLTREKKLDIKITQELIKQDTYD